MPDKKKMEMINLNQPNVNGVGVFFAVCRTAINATNWNRGDFKAVELTEGQLKYLEQYCAQEFGDEPAPRVDADAPNSSSASNPTDEVLPNSKEDKNVQAEPPVASNEEAKTDKPIEEDVKEEVDPNDKGQKRSISMPDSIKQKVLDGVEASREFIKNPPKDPVQVSTLPDDPSQYENVA